jgi:hypothetical protein
VSDIEMLWLVVIAELYLYFYNQESILLAKSCPARKKEMQLLTCIAVAQCECDFQEEFGW